MLPFHKVLNKYRQESFSERDKGNRFERLIQAYLKTDPRYTSMLSEVWLWNEFPFSSEFGGKDLGIDLVAKTADGDYWAIQCKCYAEDSIIDKKSVDTFLSTSSKQFKDDTSNIIGFKQRLWVSTTNNWNSNAEETLRNQNPPVSRINLYDLEEAPVDWEKLEEGITGELARTSKKSLRSHQKAALENTHEYFKNQDRGKLIMACGTGKTYTSLKIAENEAGNNGLVLFLVPSIALLGQTLREWTSDSTNPIYPIAICSDSGITQQRSRQDDSTFDSVVDLVMPASTDAKNITKQFTSHKEAQKSNPGMIVVFSTYQSIEVIAKAQSEMMSQGLPAEFDITICDEAHRTTGVSLSKEDESAFTKVHDNNIIKTKKRLYMTATPRLYDDNSKSKAAQNDAIICSMDDFDIYGDEIYRIGFGEAVESNLLTDYKVLILTMNEKDVPVAVQNMISDPNNEITADDASKLIGCINAMSKQVLGDEGLIKESDPDPMQRAVAFCQNIKVSKRITSTFNETTDVYLESELVGNKKSLVTVASKHIDGAMNAPERDRLLGWLKSDDRDIENECRVLTNVRCLSEGVDVPSLDAVLFLSARNSQVDVVQSVGRVMRKSPGKKYGYIVIPVVVPYDADPSKVLDDNDRFKVVWTVLNALRAHDDRFNATINKIDLNKKKPNQIMIGGAGHGGKRDDNNPFDNKETSEQLRLQFAELQSVMYAKMVKKVGNRVYWEEWAKDVAKIAGDQISRIKLLVDEDETHQLAFEKFLIGLQKNINPSIDKEQAIEMLSQHIITKPVFEALFEGYSFVNSNAVSKAMQSMMDVLEETRIQKDTEVLQKFYDSVQKRASGIDNAEGRQRIIIELYDKFFKTAFPKMVEQLGIVYTPFEVVDFMIHSVNDILKEEFNKTLSDENVHILDPFTGTGTFITRILQSGLIKQEDLFRKYTQELHANEIVLLAYYIAAINIENAYHDATEDPDDGIGKEKFTPYEGIVLTDTFQLGESEGSDKLFSEMFPQNSERVQKQKNSPIQVIIGNPPYSRGQEDANDFAQNQTYRNLENRISETYAKGSESKLSRDLYNSYMKAFRWGSDRIGDDGGIIAFITGSGFIDKGSYTGFRKSLEKEFSNVYVYDLRGDIRGRSREDAKKEGQNVFDIMTGVAISILIKKPNNQNPIIHHQRIDDYLNREEKLSLLKAQHSISKVEFEVVEPNDKNDWINQRTDVFDTFISIEPDKNFIHNSKSYFLVDGVGLASAREKWVYNYSKENLEKNMSSFIEYYNSEVQRKSISSDPKRISWSRSLKNDHKKGILHDFKKDKFRYALYKPFNKSHLYYDKPFIESPGLGSKIFPKSIQNRAICIAGKGNRKGFVALITDIIPDYNNFDGGCKFFPLFYIDENETVQSSLFDEDSDSGDPYKIRDGISDFILKRAIKQYGESVSKEDIFYYVYGILYSHEYRKRFANDLQKVLPKLPLLGKSKDFWAFSKSGRDLAELHLNYEGVPPYDQVKVEGAESQNYKVQKMTFRKTKEEFDGKSKTISDKSVIHFNSSITIRNIPEKAYEYIVNGKSAIEWIMERYQVKIDKKSGIENNPNDWAEEVGNPRYILDLLLSIINVSVQTVDIVNNLPKLDLE